MTVKLRRVLIAAQYRADPGIDPTPEQIQSIRRRLAGIGTGLAGFTVALCALTSVVTSVGAAGARLPSGLQN